MKTALEQGWHYLNNLNDLDHDSGVCFYKEDIDKAINTALQDFGEKIRSKLRNQEDIMILEDIMLKEGLK